MIQLSPIIAGTMNWGKWDKKLTPAQMANLIRVFFENGISTFDHADIYGGYTTESEFGKGFASTNIDREKVQFISKCGIQYIAENKPFRLKHYNYSKNHIISSVDQSLKNLNTDYLDVLLLHRPSPLMVAEEVAEAVESLKQTGKIKSFGLSNFTVSQMELIRKYTDVNYNQVQFSATHVDPMLDGTFDYMQTHNIQSMAWNPLGTVFREDTDQTRRLKSLFARLMDKYGVGADIMMLAWIMKHPANILPLAGTVNVGRIQQLMKATTLELEDDDWFEIWTESRGQRVP